MTTVAAAPTLGELVAQQVKLQEQIDAVRAQERAEEQRRQEEARARAEAQRREHKANLLEKVRAAVAARLQTPDLSLKDTDVTLEHGYIRWKKACVSVSLDEQRVRYRWESKSTKLALKISAYRLSRYSRGSRSSRSYPQKDDGSFSMTKIVDQIVEWLKLQDQVDQAEQRVKTKTEANTPLAVGLCKKYNIEPWSSSASVLPSAHVDGAVELKVNRTLPPEVADQVLAVLAAYDAKVKV